MTLQNYLSVLLPELILMFAGGAVLFMAMSRRSAVRGAVAPLALLSLVVAAVVTVQRDDYEAVGGLAVGSLSHYVRLITTLVGSVLILVNWHQAEEEERGEYLALSLLSMAGVMLVASSSDLIVLFFALELVSVPTYVLVALSRKDVRAQEACSKYFFLGALAAAITAYGLSFLYGVSGTTTMFGAGSIAEQMLAGQLSAGGVMLGLLLTFGGLSFKIAAVPFHGYVGDVYQGAAAPLAGLLAFLPKLAGFAALIKLLALTNWAPGATLQWVIWIVAAATMTVGNVLALMQTNVKRLLAYSSVAHSGYMLIGVLVGPVDGLGPLSDGLAAMLFYIAVYGLMNLGAFAVLTWLSTQDREVEEQEQLEGLSRREPWAAAALAVCMFSLMGLPPTAGFLGKFYIFSSAFSASSATPFGHALIWLAVIGVVNSAIAAAYYLRVVGVCYLREGVEHLAPPSRLALQVGAGICALMIVLLFFQPAALLSRAGSATHQVGAESGIRFAGNADEVQPVAAAGTDQGARGSVSANVAP